jgi:hypothetical protein
VTPNCYEGKHHFANYFSLNLQGQEIILLLKVITYIYKKGNIKLPYTSLLGRNKSLKTSPYLKNLGKIYFSDMTLNLLILVMYVPLEFYMIACKKMFNLLEEEEHNNFKTSWLI